MNANQERLSKLLPQGDQIAKIENRWPSLSLIPQSGIAEPKEPDETDY